MSPSRITMSPMVAVRSALETSMSSAPQTQVLPMPRATTAACEVLPPRAVRIPEAAIMPSRSSGLVSRRTNTTRSPSSAHLTAVAESNTAFPTAAPGDAAIPVAITFSVVAASNWGNINWASCVPLTRIKASSIVMRLSSTSWVAIRNAAAAVRFPTRVCNIQSLPFSTVNSMSHKSR